MRARPLSLWQVALAEWQVLPPLPTARAALGAASVDGAVYAVGGENGKEWLPTVERFKDGEWEPVAARLEARAMASVAAVGDAVYVLGPPASAENSY